MDVLKVLDRAHVAFSGDQARDIYEARAAVAELILAAGNALGDLTTCGTPRPIKGKERTHAMLTAALAKVRP